MTSSLTICDIPPELQSTLQQFRFKKGTNDLDALIMKVDPTTRKIVLEEELIDTSVEDLLDSLPSHQPRFVLLNYKLILESNRVTFPLVFVFISPQDCKPELQMMYAGSKLSLQKVVDCGGKVFEVRELEEFTEEWLKERLLKIA